jgi:hypothetical protein
MIYLTLDKNPDRRDPGTWWPVVLDRKRIGSICCPGCGTVGNLADHEIRDDGTVHPSCVCPEDCGFHDYVQLVGWPALDS